MKTKLYSFLMLMSFFLAYSNSMNPKTFPKFISDKRVGFEENKGQVSGRDAKNVRYFLKNRSITIYLLKNGISYQLTKTNVQQTATFLSPEELIRNHGETEKVTAESFRMNMLLKGSNPNPTITAEDPSGAIYHYEGQNIKDIQQFSKIIYHDIYPKIDWVIYTDGTQVEYDFVVKPGGNPKQIKFGNEWSEKMKINKDGSLTMSCKLGSITEKAPVSFQNGKIIPSKMVLKNSEVSFKVGKYNRNETLVIDPAVFWSTYYGGDDADYGTASVVDNAGNVYLTGYTYSGTGISSGGYQNAIAGNSDAFLAKFNSSGTLIWATYYGGNSEDKGKSVAVDASGNVYMAGETFSSNNISSAGAHQSSFGGTQDAFLVKFDTNGNRIWATYYGGDFYDEGYSCAVDPSGNVYLAGYSWSATGISTAGAHQESNYSATDGFLVKFNSNGVRQWGTYYGGDLWESGYCTTDASGNVFLAGFTSSSVNIASPGAHQTTLGWGDDAYLVKFNADGVRQWGTYYGGSNYDWAYFIATDAAGNVYLDGHTGSDAAIATAGAYQETRGGEYDAFLVKFDGNGSRVWGTYYGGTNHERASACSVDTAGNIFLVGYTYSSHGISSAGSFQEVYGGNQDVFIAKFSNSGYRIWGSYLGGSEDDFGAHCSTDAAGNIYVSGNTSSSSGIATTGAFQSNYAGSVDGFLIKLNGDPAMAVSETKQNAIKVYPNPAIDYVQISKDTAIKILKIEAFDMSGKQVLSAQSWSNNQLNVSSLNKGVYLLQITADKGTQQLKLIKK